MYVFALPLGAMGNELDSISFIHSIESSFSIEISVNPQLSAGLALSRASLRDGIYFFSTIDVKGMCSQFHCTGELKNTISL